MMMVALAQKYSNDSSTTQSQQQLLQNWHSYEIKAVILAYFLLLLLEKTCELKTSKNSQFEKWSIFQLHSKVEFPCDVTFDIYFILKPWQISLKSNPAYLNLIRKSRCPKLKKSLPKHNFRNSSHFQLNSTRICNIFYRTLDIYLFKKLDKLVKNLT